MSGLEPTPAALSRSEGSGRTAVVLLHGLCSTSDEMLALHSSLNAAGYAVEHLRIDGYSYDASSTHQQASRWQRWIDTIEARIDDLRRTHAGVVLAGISAGSSLALGAAVRCADKIDGLVLLSTSLITDGWSIPKYRFLLPLALYTPVGRLWSYREAPPYGVKNERVRSWIAHELEKRRISSAGAAVLGVPHLRENHRLVRHVRRRLGSCSMPPVLAIHAREDEVASVANVDLLARHLRTPSFRSVVVSNSYHMLTLDNDRRQVVQETLEFVHAVAQRTASIPSPL